MGKNILQYLFSGYLKLLKKTVAIEWQEIQFVTGNQVFGFWHEDSFLMNLVLEELSGKTSPVDVIVTADTRGDYIEHMLQACGGHALRVPDGFAAFGALKKILQDSYEQTRSIAVALDGPRGPRHEQKAGILSGRAGTGVFCGNFSFLSWMSSAVLEMGPLCDSTSVFENQRRSSRLWRS